MSEDVENNNMYLKNAEKHFEIREDPSGVTIYKSPHGEEIIANASQSPSDTPVDNLQNHEEE